MSGTTDAEVTTRSRTFARAQLGMDAPRVIVETHLPGGLPGTTLVGVPEAAVREARDRVKSALINCGYAYPDGRVVVNLAPVDLAKEGGRFDLAIAISILRASGQLLEQATAFDYEFLGELSLTGELRRVRGCLCAALYMKPSDRLIVPRESGAEVAPAADRVLPLAHLKDVTRLLSGTAQAEELVGPPRRLSRLRSRENESSAEPAYPTVLGQNAAKRALAIAAAGNHHLLMVGPPGTGKSLLAARFPALLPELSDHEAMEVAAVYSAAGLDRDDYGRRPFRSPHHSVSATAMTGGGAHPRPGEITLAHHGVLFLDELPHFKPSVLDSLREPLESRHISISRTSGQARFPASFQLLAAMNPCPSGLVCSDSHCRCRPDQVRRYQARISGPLLDRIDLHVPVPEVPKELLLGETREHAAGGADADRSDATEVREVREVRNALERQLQRQGKTNASLTTDELDMHAALDRDGKRILSRATDHYRLSARGFHRVLRVARSIADLGGESQVGVAHLGEALGYRAMDWSGFTGLR